MILSKLQLEKGLPRSNSTKSMHFFCSCWSGRVLRDSKAVARSVFASILALCLIGVTTASMAHAKSTLVSEGVKVPVANLENLFYLTMMSWQVRRSMLVFI